MMELKEAIDELILDVDYTLEEIENHEEFEDEEQGEYQIQAYEDNKKKLEAYLVIFGALDPTLKTINGLKERCDKVKEERYGSSDAGELPEPSEFEKQLYEVLNPWCKKESEENGGCAVEFTLDVEENAQLAKINIEKGEKQCLFDEDPDEAPEPTDADEFTFYTYRGRVQVIYNDYADGDFYSYPIEFQEKAYEIIKKKIGEV